MTEDLATPVPAAIRACQHLWLPVNDDAYENLHMLIMLSNPSPFTAAMLADTPSPHGSDATPKSVGYIVRGSRTVRYLAALPRRIRLVGQTVCLLLTQTITSSSFQDTSQGFT